MTHHRARPLRTLAALSALVLCSAAGSPASAGVMTDDMSRCLVHAATPQDNEVLVRWIFSAISVHPSLKGLTSLTEAQRTQYDHDVAALFQRLILVDCRKAAVDAVRTEGASAIEASFGVLGQAAMRDIMVDQGVADGMTHLTRYLDNTRWKAFGVEAGAPVGDGTATPKP